MMRGKKAGASLAEQAFVPEKCDAGQMRIGEMAEQFGVTLRTLRFYEDKGLLTPERAGTTRLYGRRERARLKLILLGRKVGFSLREVKQLMDLYESQGTNFRQMKVALEKSEKQLKRLEDQRANLDEAVADLKIIMRIVASRLEAHNAGDRDKPATACC